MRARIRHGACTLGVLPAVVVVNKPNTLAAVIIAAVLAAALVGVFAMRGTGEADELRAIVHVDGGDTYELPLSDDTELEVVTPGTDYSNTVVVEHGAVHVREANCDNQDCVHQGSIDAPGRQIICLPHKLWIEVVAQGESGGSMDVGAAAGEGGLDAVSR